MIGTMFGSGGLMYVAYFKARGLEKTVFRSTLAMTFLLDGAGRIVGFASAGFFTKEFFTMLAMALPLMGIPG